jgi:hypothetical protein
LVTTDLQPEAVASLCRDKDIGTGMGVAQAILHKELEHAAVLRLVEKQYLSAMRQKEEKYAKLLSLHNKNIKETFTAVCESDSSGAALMQHNELAPAGEVTALFFPSGHSYSANYNDSGTVYCMDPDSDFSTSFSAFNDHSVAATSMSPCRAPLHELDMGMGMGTDTNGHHGYERQGIIDHQPPVCSRVLSCTRTSSGGHAHDTITTSCSEKKSAPTDGKNCDGGTKQIVDMGMGMGMAAVSMSVAVSSADYTAPASADEKVNRTNQDLVDEICKLKAREKDVRQYVTSLEKQVLEHDNRERDHVNDSDSPVPGASHLHLPSSRRSCKLVASISPDNSSQSKARSQSQPARTRFSSHSWFKEAHKNKSARPCNLVV